MDFKSKFLLLREMVVLGFTSRTVSMEVEVPSGVLRGFFQRAGQAVELPDTPTRTGKNPTGRALIKTESNKVHASFFVGIYRHVGGSSVLEAFDIKAFKTALCMYRAQFDEVVGSPLFDIDYLYFLTRELRDKNIRLRLCRKCDCRYVHWVEQQRISLECPFC